MDATDVTDHVNEVVWNSDVLKFTRRYQVYVFQQFVFVLPSREPCDVPTIVVDGVVAEVVSQLA